MMMMMPDPVSFVGRPQGADFNPTQKNVNREESFDKVFSKADQKMKPRSNKTNPSRTEESPIAQDSSGREAISPPPQATPIASTDTVREKGDQTSIVNGPADMEIEGDLPFLMKPINLSKDLIEFFPELFKGVESASLLNPSLAVSAGLAKMAQAQFVSWKSPMLALENQNIESRVIEQIVQKLSLQQLELHGKGGMTLMLEPKELGALKVEISVHKGAVSAEILTQNPAVREILEKNQAILLNALSHSGFNVEQFSVNVGDFQNRSNTGNEDRQSVRFLGIEGSSSEASLLAGIGEALRGKIYPESAVSLYI